MEHWQLQEAKARMSELGTLRRRGVLGMPLIDVSAPVVLSGSWTPLWSQRRLSSRARPLAQPRQRPGSRSGAARNPDGDHPPA